MASDLFGDQGVLKTVLRASSEPNHPKPGDEVAIVYNLLSGPDRESKNLIYTVGNNHTNAFIPLRTLDKIVCDMKRNEKVHVRISPQYSTIDDFTEVEITLLQIRPLSSNNGLSSLGSPLGDFQNHLLRNPDVMEQMMSSPQMQSLLSNPETMRSLMGMNPQMQQLLEQNPELNNLINDPEFLQQSMEAMRNPALMSEMMRNNDRAMSNIESLPGGSAALNKLYNEIQAPLFEAAQDVGSRETMKKITDSKQLKAKYGDLAYPNRPISQPMDNPWDRRPAIPTPTVPAVSNSSGRSLVDMSAMAQMMQDPGMNQMMASMFRSQAPPPQTLPFSAHGTQTRNPLEDPSFLQQMFNPNMLQAMARLEQSLGALGGQVPPQSGAFSGLFGNFMTAQQNDPEVRYRTQLATLRSMGFTDTRACISALDQSSGNVNRAIEILMLARQSQPNPQ